MSGTKQMKYLAIDKLVPNFTHYESDCKGVLEIIIQDRVQIGLSGLGVTILKHAPLIVCKTCEAAYLPEGLELAVEQGYAKWLIIQNRLLAPSELRFLRVITGDTQAELAAFLEVDRTYLSKCESPKNSNLLSFDKQHRVRLYVARKLSKNDHEFLSIVDKLVYIKDDQDLPENVENPKLPQEIEKVILDQYALSS